MFKNKENIVALAIIILFIGIVGLSIRTWFVAKQADRMAWQQQSDIAALRQEVDTEMTYLQLTIATGILPTPQAAQAQYDIALLKYQESLKK